MPKGSTAKAAPLTEEEKERARRFQRGYGFDVTAGPLRRAGQERLAGGANQDLLAGFSEAERQALRARASEAFEQSLQRSSQIAGQVPEGFFPQPFDTGAGALPVMQDFTRGGGQPGLTGFMPDFGPVAQPGSLTFSQELDTPTGTDGEVIQDTGGSGEGGSVTGEPILNQAALQRLSQLVDPTVLSSFLQQLSVGGWTVVDMYQDEFGDIQIQAERPGIGGGTESRTFSIGSAAAAGTSGLGSARLELDARALELDEAFRRDELALRERLAELDATIARERIEADQEIAQGNWDNALAIQDRIDERERQQRELDRELFNMQMEFNREQLALENQRFQLDRQEFIVGLTQTPLGRFDLLNTARGLPTIGTGGPLPGGLERVGGGGLADFLRDLIGPVGELGGGAPAQPGELPDDTDELLPTPGGGGGTGGGAGVTQPLNASVDGQPVGANLEQLLQLPPAILEVMAGRQPGSLTQSLALPPGALPILSTQQRGLLSPDEAATFDALSVAQGVPPELRARIEAAVAPPLAGGGRSQRAFLL